MRFLVLFFALTFATAVSAQSSDDAPSLMERGAQLLLEGILKELEPALDGFEDMAPQLRDFAARMGPALVEMLDEVKDWSRYHPPEMLPNGDIIIRRKRLDTEPKDDDVIDL